MNYFKLLGSIEKKVKVHERPLPKDLKGLYYNNNILINKNIETFTEKKCILAEEYAHYKINSGNILNQSDIVSRKEEIKARNLAMMKLIPLTAVIDAMHEGIRNSYELAEYLDVTEEFLLTTLDMYKSKYGNKVIVDKYLFNLKTLEVYEYMGDEDFNKYVKGKFKEYKEK